MYNAEVPVRTFTLLTREYYKSSFSEGEYWQGAKIKEEHFDTLDEIVHRIVDYGGYSVEDKFYSVGISHGHRVIRKEKDYRWSTGHILVEKEEYVTFVILDNWGNNVLKSELLEYATFMPARHTWWRRRGNGVSKGKSGGHRGGYGKCGYANRKRVDSSLDQDSNVRFRDRKKSQDWYDWPDYRKGQSTNWKHTRKTQYK